jgi:hypothetical protein
MTEGNDKTAKVMIGVWFREDTGHIHVSIPGHDLSTVSNDAGSKRGNPHLFNKLAKVLRDQGKPHPPIVEDWDYGRGE